MIGKNSISVISLPTETNICSSNHDSITATKDFAQRRRRFVFTKSLKYTDFNECRILPLTMTCNALLFDISRLSSLVIGFSRLGPQCACNAAATALFALVYQF